MAKINEPAEVTGQKQHLARIFSLSAPTYDRVGPRLFSYFGRRLVETAQIQPGATVLDIATGRGAVLFPAAEGVGANGHVTGIDLSEGMVQETNREIMDRLMVNVDVRQMDAEYLQLADQSFDYVLCGLSIFFFPQLDRALSELLRVLKPGGRIAWTTFLELFEEEWSWFEELIGAYLQPRDKDPTDERTEDPTDEQEPVFNSAEGVERIMRKAGFTGIEVDSETADFIYADEETYWESLYSTAIRATLERIEKVHGRVGLERFKNELFVALKRKKGADGIHQPFSVLYAVGIKPA